MDSFFNRRHSRIFTFYTGYASKVAAPVSTVVSHGYAAPVSSVVSHGYAAPALGSL